MRTTPLHGSMLEALTKGRTEEQIAFMSDVMHRGFESLLDSGKDPSEVYNKAIPVFGEGLLIETGIVELVTERIERKEQ